VQRRLLLDVIVRQRAAILQLLAGEDEALLVGRDACDGLAASHEGSEQSQSYVRVGLSRRRRIVVLGSGGGGAEGALGAQREPESTERAPKAALRHHACKVASSPSLS